MAKPLSELDLADFDVAPVWSSNIEGCDDETVEPRPEMHVVPENRHGLWVRFRGALADGTAADGIAMAECPPPNLLLHSFHIDGEWYSVHFPPAPDFVLAHDGPQRLAEQLHRPIADVFPITVVTDISSATDHKPIRQIISAEGPVGPVT